MPRVIERQLPVHRLLPIGHVHRRRHRDGSLYTRARVAIGAPLCHRAPMMAFETVPFRWNRQGRVPYGHRMAVTALQLAVGHVAGDRLVTRYARECLVWAVGNAGLALRNGRSDGASRPLFRDELGTVLNCVGNRLIACILARRAAAAEYGPSQQRGRGRRPRPSGGGWSLQAGVPWLETASQTGCPDESITGGLGPSIGCGSPVRSRTASPIWPT